MTSLSVEAKPQDTQRPRVWRVEVHPRRAEDDPQGHSLLQEVREMQLAQNLREVRTCQVYLLQTTLDQQAVERIAGELLCDPIHQRYRLGATPRDDQAQMVEVHRLPGVMDPVARSAGGAIAEMTGATATCAVRTGARYDLYGASEAEADQIARRLLANTVIESVSNLPEWPQQFTQGRPYEFRRVSVPIRDLDADALANLSRDGHLFLSPVEMKAIQDHFLAAGREPTDIELETLAQTWSEHCVHKTLKSTVRYRQAEGAGPSAAPGPSDWSQRPGHRLTDDGSVVIENLLKSTIAAATHQLIEEGADWCISVFVDNAGIVAFDDEHAITFKVETHNHPSAIEPYGGAATGAGGCIRDTMGTGLCAKPIANTDVFAVADPSLAFGDLPRGVLHPRRILKQVVAGVRDYGNRMGIPTLNGAVWFDDRYLGNPLVFCGSVGLIPRDKCFGDANTGDRIVVIGGRTGRDGIHGATFSSAELTDTHADEFSHAVQIGDPITEKKALDVILAARDHPGGPLFSAITDCGAGGFSSAVGEMGEKLGAEVQLDQAPLKYEGLSYTEIWISEAQERMVLAVPPRNVPELLALCASEDVEACDLGHFGTERQELVLRYQEQEVGRLSMKFVHEGLPQPTREAHWEPAPPAAAPSPPQTRTDSDNLAELLGALLAHPNIASKHWIIRQYDHEVQGGSVLKPLTGAEGDGPGDAAVIRPKLGSSRGIALSCGLATDLGDIDPYWMVLAAVDEAVRNAVCVGARPDRIAILDNFCWPGCDDPQQMASLVRAAEACYDAA
ncbi:MAG: phosphoribosylformylglycinamidine synthase subunit PurS, partial [Phycisphaerae bacterium]|nr:phosphoribosylformylglycinamidine synthase subunit PurS [Phycisphaerae bacterium]